MAKYLGEISYKDEEWGGYYWFVAEKEDVTKFYNVTFGNCFDVDIYGNECCIDFRLLTT